MSRARRPQSRQTAVTRRARRNLQARRIVLATLLIVAITSSCGSASDQDVDALDDLFGAVASHRVFVDNTFGGQDVFENVSVVSVVGRADDDGSIVGVDASARELTTDERVAIEAALAPKEVAFVPFDTAPPLNDEQVEAVLLFAEPIGGSKEAVVTTSMLCGAGCGAGGAQRFTLTEDSWSFVENVGPQWVS